MFSQCSSRPKYDSGELSFQILLFGPCSRYLPLLFNLPNSMCCFQLLPLLPSRSLATAVLVYPTLSLFNHPGAQPQEHLKVESFQLLLSHPSQYLSYPSVI